MICGTQGRSHSSSPCEAAPASLVLTPQLGGPPGSLPVSAKCYSPGKPQDIVLCSSAALTCRCLGQTSSHPFVQTCHTAIPTLTHQDDTTRGIHFSPGLAALPSAASGQGPGRGHRLLFSQDPADEAWRSEVGHGESHTHTQPWGFSPNSVPLLARVSN